MTTNAEFTYFTDPQLDKVVSLCWQLAQELSVTRNRLIAVEELLAAKGVLAPGEVQTAELPDDARERLAADRLAMVNRLVRVLTEDDDHNAPTRRQFKAQATAQSSA